MFDGQTQVFDDPGPAARNPLAATSSPGALDFLGRMPIPLRRPFKTGLDRVVAARRAENGVSLSCCFLMGGEWQAPFAGLTARSPDDLPGMVVSSWSADLMTARWLDHFAGPTTATSPPAHPACIEGGLCDPLGACSVFAVIPLVFLVDHGRLGDRPVPRRWGDLLGPHFRRDVIFGGWRPNDRVPFTDFNEFLLLCLLEEFGRSGIEAFAANVKMLAHNIRTVRTAGTDSDEGAAVAVLPWLQADLCPRRARTSVVWPEDGALAMPIGFVAKPEQRDRLRPLIDYVTGPDLGAVLAKNRYPPVAAAIPQAFPPGARLKWPGWDHVRSHDMTERTTLAARHFFAAWAG